MNQFVAPIAQVRALRYCHRYMTEHPELGKGIRRLFPLGHHAGKELSAASISLWMCTAVVDSHASFQSSMNIIGKVKAQEVRAVATSL